MSSFEPTTNTSKGDGTRYKYKASVMGLKTTLETEINDFVENKGWRGIVVKGMPHETLGKEQSVDSQTSAN